MNRVRKIAILGVLIATIAAFGLPSAPIYAMGCLTEGNTVSRFDFTYDLQELTWTEEFYMRTTPYCHDLNVAINLHGCDVLVHAEYQNSAGQWINAARGDFWLTTTIGSNLLWDTPITNLRDGVLTKILFLPACSQHGVGVHLAA